MAKRKNGSGDSPDDTNDPIDPANQTDTDAPGDPVDSLPPADDSTDADLRAELDLLRAENERLKQEAGGVVDQLAEELKRVRAENETLRDRPEGERDVNTDIPTAVGQTRTCPDGRVEVAVEHSGILRWEMPPSGGARFRVAFPGTSHEPAIVEAADEADAIDVYKRQRGIVHLPSQPAVVPHVEE